MQSISLCNDACSRDISGGYSDGVPPLPIPNREVKPDRADGTAHPRESRSPPFYKTSLETRKRLGALLCLDDWREKESEERACSRGMGNFGGRSALPRVLFEDLEAFRGGTNVFGDYCALFGMSLSLYRFLL